MRRLLWILLACVLAGAPVARAESLTLVYQGQLSDLPYLVLPQGRFVSAQSLVDFLQKHGGVAVQSRPEKGLIVLSPGGSGGGTLAGFASPDLVVMVGDQTFATVGQLQGGVPFLPVGVFQAALEGAGFAVVGNPEAGLMAVSRPPVPDAPPAAPAPPSTTGVQAGGADLTLAINQGVADALRAMGGPGVAPAAPAPGKVAWAQEGSSSAEVCAAMDVLRDAWGATEPSRQEKQTFQDLATRFENAKQDPTLVNKGDVTTMLDALSGFRGRVEDRSAATQSWAAPSEAARVKSLGNAFLSHYLELLLAMEDATERMQKGEHMPQGEIDALAERIRNMEAIIHSEGRSFDAEVTRVRSAHGCGPATVSKPSS